MAMSDTVEQTAGRWHRGKVDRGECRIGAGAASGGGGVGAGAAEALAGDAAPPEE